MSKVWNTTGFKVDDARAMGKDYPFDAFEEKEVWNEEHAEHLGKSFENSGIVCLRYDEAAQKKFGSYDDYKSDRERHGLKKALSRYELALADEKQYLRDVTKNGGTEGDKTLAKVDEFETKVKALRQWLKDAGAEVVEKKADSIPKRPIWRKLKNDTDTTTNKG